MLWIHQPGFHYITHNCLEQCFEPHSSYSLMSEFTQTNQKSQGNVCLCYTSWFMCKVPEAVMIWFKRRSITSTWKPCMFCEKKKKCWSFVLVQNKIQELASSVWSVVYFSINPHFVPLIYGGFAFICVMQKSVLEILVKILLENLYLYPFCIYLNRLYSEFFLFLTKTLLVNYSVHSGSYLVYHL